MGAYEELVGTHKPGSISRIKLKNFLTYDFVEFFPGPRYVILIQRMSAKPPLEILDMQNNPAFIF